MSLTHDFCAERVGTALDIFPAGNYDNAMSYYFYILECSDKGYYYGSTANLKERMTRHKQGRVGSTRHRRPVRLVYFEDATSRSDTLKREKRFKSGRTRKETRDRLIKEFPAEKLRPYQ